MTRKSITTDVPSPLDLSQTRNNEDALSDIPRTLSANAAWLAGYIQGGDTLDSDTPNLAPRSPMHGIPGHTHAGGLDGRPLFRTVASMTFDPHTVHSSNLSANGSIAYNKFVARAEGDEPGGNQFNPGHVVRLPLTPDFVLPIPGCDPVQGAYQNMAVRLTFVVHTNTNVDSGDQLDLKVKNFHGDGFGCTLSTTGLDASTPALFTLYSDTGTTGETIRTAPGQPNAMQVWYEFTASSVTGARTVELELLELELGVYEQAPSVILYDLNAETGFSDTDPIGTLSDQRSDFTSSDATASGTARPTYSANEINGLAAADFDGSDDLLDIGSAAGRLTRCKSGLSIITVAASDSTAAGTPYICYLEDGDGTVEARILVGRDGSSWRMGGRRLDSDNFVAISGGTISAGDPAVVVGVADYEADAAYLYVDGTEVASDTTFQSAGRTEDTDGNSGGAIGGKPGGGSHWDGPIGYVMIVGKALSAAEVTYITDALQKDWSF